MLDLIEILKDQPKYRRDQILKAWFDVHLDSFEKITTLPKDLRSMLSVEKWLCLEPITVQTSTVDSTQKALFRLSDGLLIESVLMGRINKKVSSERDFRHTICISTQVGCPMKCVFCATGKLGFKRNLTWREMIDEVRFWQIYLYKNFGDEAKISNIVLMGEGEPLLNYDNVKESLNIILGNLEIGPRQITVSTCGVPEGMDKIVTDIDWPPVRLALSLHSAIEETRKKIMPSHCDGFLDFLVGWSKKFHERFSSRTQFVGLEYTLLAGVNDDDKHLRALKKLASKLGRVRINLIPYNATSGEFRGSDETIINKWHEEIMAAGFTSTVRRSQGQDIAAACGQLALQSK